MGKETPKFSNHNVSTFILNWKYLSRITRKARSSGAPSLVNQALEEFINFSEENLLTPTLLLWMGDNLYREARFSEAIQKYNDIVEEFKNHALFGQPKSVRALQKIAVCNERLGNISESLAACRKLVELHPEYEVQSQLEIGRILEGASRDSEAIKEYKTAVSAVDAIDIDAMTDRFMSARNSASHSIKWIEEASTWLRPHPGHLSTELVEALRKKDAKSLGQLTAQSHFYIGGWAGRLSLANLPELMEQLAADLAASTLIRADEASLDGKGMKFVLRTNGWEGELFKGEVRFILMLKRGGWEWGGIALHQSPEDWLHLVDKTPQYDGIELTQSQHTISDYTPFETPLSVETLGLKAPWPAGRFFRAGGANAFAGNMVTVAALTAAAMGGNWMAGLILNKFLAAKASEPCGFGPNGQYYEQGGHTSSASKYSVDFTSSDSNFPFANNSEGTPVLSSALGRVRFLKSSMTSGDSSSTGFGNYVKIDHYREDELFAAALVAMSTGELPRSKYSAYYSHLQGPGLVTVSDDMYVDPGDHLGYMDDTGSSGGSHLHFQLFEVSGYIGVRPSPLDGQTLNDNEDGKCLSSTNVLN